VAKVIKVQGDTSGIEGNLPQAPVGLYFAKVDEISAKKSKNNEDMVEIIWNITKDANGKKVKKPFARIWSYAPLDPKSSWARRLKELIEAFGLASKNANVGLIEGKEAMVRLREDTDNDGEYRPQISKVLKPKAADDDEDEPDEVDDEDEADDEEEDGDDAVATAVLAGMNRTALKALIKEEELEVKVLKSMSDDDLREAIIGAGWEPEGAEDEEEDEDEDEEEDDDEEAEEDNYDDMSIKELRQECKDRELDTKGGKPVLIARLRTDDEEEPV
jgi:hypothetical protein